MTQINLSLNPEQVQYVLNALANCPYGQVFSLIAEIQGQAQAQLPNRGSQDSQPSTPAEPAS